MADIKFSQLGAAAALTGVEIIPLVQGGVNVRATVSALGSFLGTGYVSKTGDEDIGGVKTFTNISNWNLSAQGRIIYGEPGGNMTGITMYRGAWATNLARRGDIRVRATDMLLGVGAAADNAAPVNFVSVGPDFFRPTVPALWNLGTSGNGWLNVFTNEIYFTGDDAAKMRSRTSLQAVGNIGNESIDGIKTFVGNNAIRSLAVGAGFWLESSTAGTTVGFLVNTDGDRLNVNMRNTSFGAQVSTLFQMTPTGFRFGAPLTPISAGTQTVGTASTPFQGVYVNEFTMTGTTTQKDAARASLGAVGLTGNETVAGVKTFSQTSVFNLGVHMPGDTARLVFGDASVENGSLRATTTNAIVLAAGPGTAGSTGQLILRPNGNSVTTGQVTILGTGAITFGGDAASKLATMSSLGAVNDSGAQTIAGNKTFSGASLFTGSITQRTGTIGGVEIQSPTGIPGIVGRNGDPADVNNQYRHDLHFGAGFVRMLAATAVGSGAPAGGWRMDSHFYPVQNNVMSCGTTSNLWTQVCATNGTINTSDERLKTPLEHMTDAEESAFLEISELPMKWKWLARQDEEGDAARLHAGPGVQSAMAIMEKYKLEPFSYSAFCHDAWPAQAEKWREWPAEAEEVIEWPAVPEQWADIPATPEVWLETPEVPALWNDIPEVPAIWDETPEIAEVWQDVEATYDDDGLEVTPAHKILVQEGVPATRTLVQEAQPARRELVREAVPASRELVQEAQPARRELVHEAIPAGRVVTKEAVEAGRELVQAAVEAGDRYSFRVSELQAWILAAMARRDCRVREQVEARMTALEARLAALEAK